MNNRYLEIKQIVTVRISAIVFFTSALIFTNSLIFASEYRYVNSENLYSFVVPDGWKLNQDGNSAFFEAPERFNDTPIFFAIRYDPINKKELDDESMKQVEFTLQYERNAFEILTKKEIQVDSKKGFLWECTYKINNVKMRTHYIIAIYENRLYHLALIGPEDGFKVYLREIEDAIKTFSFDVSKEENLDLLNEFSDEMHHVQLKYPSGWYRKVDTSEDSYKVYLSKEKVKNIGDIYTVGFALVKVFNAKKQLNFTSNDPKEISKKYLKQHIENISTSESVIVAFPCSPIELKDARAYVTELTFRGTSGYWATVFLVTAFQNDTFVLIMLEAPREEFEKYRQLYYTTLLPNMGVF